MRGRCSVKTNSPPVKSVLRLGQQHRHLDRKNELTIEILVQAVVIASPVLQEQRRGLGLSGLVAKIEIFGMALRKLLPNAHALIPAVRELSQRRIKRCAQLAHQLGQWVVEIFVLAAAEAVPSHDHPASETLIRRISVHQTGALITV